MAKSFQDQLRDSLGQTPKLVRLLAATLVLFGLWMAWNGVDQLRYSSKKTELEATRDNGAQLVQQALLQHRKRMLTGLASPEVQTALLARDLPLAAKLVGATWPNVQKIEVLPADLASAYAALPQGGFGRLAAAEAAIFENRPVHWIVQEGGTKRLALAAPALAGGELVGVLYVQLPVSELIAGVDALGQADDSYLALRQGTVTVWERGDQAYADAAERTPRAISDSELRMVSATVSEPNKAFGLDAVSAMVLVLVCFGVAYVLWRLSRTRMLPQSVGDDAPTLDQLAAEATPAEEEAPQIEIRERPRATPVLIDRSIFRAYDIRGIVGKTLDPGVARLIGQSVGSLMHEQDLREIVIGRDGRLSGQDMVDGLIDGLRLAGRDVIDIGMVPTPVAYFGAYHLRTGCCVSVTGSHNPPDYNGFKIVVGGETLSGDAILDLHARIADNRLYTSAQMGSIAVRDIGTDYVQRIASDVQLGRRIKVVVDAGNGVAGELGPRVLEAIGAEVEELYCEIDGNFPNHHPDPSEPHNLEDLTRMVKRLDAELGIAFDGDGDRLGVVTRSGENIYADRLLMLFASDVLERNPGAMIVYDVKCTGRLSGHVLRHGGSPLMWKTGHSLIKAKMRETGAELAGEMSGHFFFAERWYGFDDGIYAAARLLEILASAPETPEELFATLPKGVSTPELKVDAPGGDPHTFVERFRDGASFEGARLSTIDGLRVDWPDGWGLVRASNTTPVLVLRFDADNPIALTRIQNVFRARLLEIDPKLSLPF
jgi:phosphomannomutase/phosphoglucomutase